MTRPRFFLAVIAGALLVGAVAARAQDTLKVAAGQRGNWDTTIAEVGQRAGIFKRHGITLEILWTQGGGETQQAVISGSVDIGVAPGIMGVLSAFSKGAPVRVIGAETTGASDLYWYVVADSPIKSLKDTEGKTIAYSTTGSSTHGVVTAFMKQYDLKAKPTATGGPPATYTMTMTGQIDIGWAVVPFGLAELQAGKIRVVARGPEVPTLRNQTIRVQVANANALKERKDVMVRFMRAYRESIDWMYANPLAVKYYAETIKQPEELVVMQRDQYNPKDALSPDRLSDLDQVMADAVEMKFLDAPLTKEQLAEFFQIPPPGT